jgi:hypothetical protein
MDEIERRIQFYKVSWFKGEDPINKDINFLNSILTGIPYITTADSSFNIYIENFNDKALVSTHTDKSFWIISKIRRTDYPLKINLDNRVSGPLNLEENEGLQEPSHFIIFGDSCIGAELNFNAARVATTLNREVNKYLEKIQCGVDEILIEPILRDNSYNKIDNMWEISSVLVKLSTNYAKTLNKIPDQRNYSFGKTFDSHDAVEDLFLGVQFYVGRGRKPKSKKFFEQVISDVRALLKRPDSLESVEMAKVRGKQFGADSIEVVDLLEDRLMVQRKVAKLDEKTKAVNPRNMFENILDSYEILKHEIDKYSLPKLD